MDTGFRRVPLLVAPAEAGVQGKGVLWIPAFAGMTKGYDEEKTTSGSSCTQFSMENRIPSPGEG